MGVGEVVERGCGVCRIVWLGRWVGAWLRDL